MSTKLPPTTPAPETPATATAPNPHDVFEAGLRSQPPVEVIPGTFIHHKDLSRMDMRETYKSHLKATTPGPTNPAGSLYLLTPESFAAALVDYRDNRTQVFADSEQSNIVAIFDCMQRGDGYYERKAGWGQFSAAISFTESRKLKEWKKTLEWMTQAEFANFIEDHLEDAVEPSGQHLLEIATDLEASSTGGFKGKVNLANGSVRLAYQDEVETTVEVPRNLTLGIPLFEHGDRYKLGARLRFVIQGGTVKFRLLFTNLADAKEQEFERIVQEIEEKTSHPIYRGRVSLPW